MIRICNLAKYYETGAPALTNINLNVSKGEFVYITGPSGAGKSTLLRLLFCGTSPTRGQILVNGRNITRMGASQIPYLRRQLGVVFQDFKLIKTRTLMENVAFPLEVQGIRRQEVAKRVFRALQMEKLEKYLKKYPLEISGGEQQRVAIARALVTDPLVLLADEPTGNLDDQTTLEIMELFKSANARGTTVIMATHNLELIRRHPRRVVVLKGGKIVEDHDTPLSMTASAGQAERSLDS